MCASAQERKLGEQERKDLEKEVAELEGQLSEGTADSATLRRAAAAYAALGDNAQAGAALEKLTAQEPSDYSMWQALVSHTSRAHFTWSSSNLPVLLGDQAQEDNPNGNCSAQ